MEYNPGLIGQLRKLVADAPAKGHGLNDWWVIGIQNCLLDFYEAEEERRARYSNETLEREMRRVLEK